ncbi:MAG: ATP-binding cassette domain-containing protein [Pseudomonadota bacterium]
MSLLCKIDNAEFGHDAGDMKQVLSFQISNNDCVAVNGVSGSGKSTILNTIAGLCPIRSGTLTTDYRRLGYAFQDNRLLPWRTTEENILLGCQVRDTDPVALRERLDSLLDYLDLEQARSNLPHELSGGMQQRANLARALIGKPDLLLLDEVLTAQDSRMARLMADLILSEQSQWGFAIMQVAHSPSHVISQVSLHLQLSHDPCS